MMAKKDQLSDEQIKALEGKSAEEIVAVRYPGQLPDYQRLKSSRYYEENKESLQYVDIGLKALAVLSMIGGTVLAPATSGASLYATYSGAAYLAADNAYSAFNGHTMITGNQLSTEERVWAGIDAVVTLVSMGSAGYLTKLAQSEKNGSTILKGLATAGKHADDLNDVSKVVYSFATDQDPNAALQNLVLGQVMGIGMNSAGNYIGGKIGRSIPSVDIPSTKTSHLDVPLQAKQLPKLDPDSVRLSSRKDLHLKASTADGTLAKLKSHPAVSMDVPKVKQISGDNVSKTISGVKPGDVDVPKVKAVSDVEAPTQVGAKQPKTKDIPSERLENLDSLEPLVNGPYIRDGKPYGRPTLTGDKKLEFERAVYNKQVDPDGVLRDPNTGDVIDWKPGQSRRGVVDFGHKEGKTYKKMFEKYKNREITLQELKDFQFNPDNFRIETPSANRSHKFE